MEKGKGQGKGEGKGELEREGGGKGKGDGDGEGEGANVKHHLSLPDSGGLMLLLDIRLLAFLLATARPLRGVLPNARGVARAVGSPSQRPS